MAILDRCKPILGTYVDISLNSANTDAVTLLEASNAAFAQIQAIHDLMSFHEYGSQLSQINREALHGDVEISPAMHDVLKTALDLSAATDGLYDITIASQLVKNGKLPWHEYAPDLGGNWKAIHLQKDSVYFSKNIIIDLGGIAKGYAVDCAFEYLLSLPFPFTQITINAGGDMRMLHWQNQKIVIRSPAFWGRNRLVEVAMRSGALATSVSGRGSQSSHVLNPKTFKLIKAKKSISVFANNCMIADALTKIMYLAPDRTDILDSYQASGLSINSYGQRKALNL